MEKDTFPHYRDMLRILAPLVFGMTIGMAPDAKAQEPFCTPDDLCVTVKGRVTGYVPLAPNGAATGQCTEPCDITASGEPVMFGRTAACPTHVPFGVQVHIESEAKAGGKIYTCLDHGDMDKTHVDVAVNDQNDDPFPYTDLDARITFKYREGPPVPIYPEVNLFTREYQRQPKDSSTQIPSLSR